MTQHKKAEFFKNIFGKKKMENAKDIPIDETETVENEAETVVEIPQNQPEIDDSAQQISELKDKYLRLYAEFDNFKRRTATERIELMKTAARDTMSALLPVLDDFDRAKKISEKAGSTEVFTEGVSLVYAKLQHILKQKGLETNDATGENFDSEQHEAVVEIPAPTPELAGKVIETIENGYFLNGKLIRHAKVVVGKAV